MDEAKREAFEAAAMRKTLADAERMDVAAELLKAAVMKDLDDSIKGGKPMVIPVDMDGKLIMSGCCGGHGLMSRRLDKEKVDS